MPFYEYQCDDCGHRLEVLQKISDTPLVYCPECSQASLKKLISMAAFRLKGTGWYETDFKNGANTKQKLADKESTDSDSTSDSGKGTDKKTDSTKPAKSKETAASSAAPAQS